MRSLLRLPLTILLLAALPVPGSGAARRPPVAAKTAATPKPTAARAPHVEQGALVPGAEGRLYVEVLGSGGDVPLVVLHGGPGYAHDYFHCSPAWDSLARARRVVFYDQRGVGRSGPLRVGQSLNTGTQVADLEAVRKHLGAERIDVLGHSYGGYLAMAYTVKNPSRVAHLILCDSSDPNWNATHNALQMTYPDRAPAVMESLAVATTDRPSLRRAFGEYMGMMFYSTELRDAFLAHSEWLEIFPEVNATLRRGMLEENLRVDVLGLRLPTLVLSGRYDFVAVPGVAWELRGFFRGSRLRVFERSGHLPFYEEPREFVREVETFLAGR